jgi:putative ABC transport system permease protein
MKIGDSLVVALRSMREAKLRTTLTALGVVIGVAAVIVLVGLGNGMKTGVRDAIGPLATVIQVSQSEGNVPGAKISRRLTDDDAAALANKAEAPNVVSVVPQFSGSAVVHRGAANLNTQLWGSGPGFLDIFSQELLAGRVYTEEENRQKARVAVIGQGVVDSLFRGDLTTALGSEIVIGRMNFRVIGVMKRSTLADTMTVIPLVTARTILLGGSNRLTLIGVMATSVDRVPAAMEEITQILDREHRIITPGLRDFQIDASIGRLQRTEQFLDQMTVFTLGIASIALLVGAVGVANIMLVTVNGRTREIGIRTAVGARQGAIIRQFLLESMTLSGLGGAVGAAFGVGLVLLGAYYLPRYLPYLGRPEVSPTATAVSFAISLVIGLLAGCYPAWRASRLHPVDALRH